MKSFWVLGIVAATSVIGCGAVEEGQEPLGPLRNGSGGAHSSAGTGGNRYASSSGGDRSNASGGAPVLPASGGASPIATSGGGGSAPSAPASGGGGAGGGFALGTSGAGVGGRGLFFGTGGASFATGGVRNTAGSPQGGFTTTDPDFETHIDLNGDGWIDLNPPSGESGEGGAGISIDWGAP
ncbi:MAG TPA: hypothetical protein VFQ35_14160 [Polyangiaceae bacterium]|nr:hypothetical protein [Polyangiaceae bacterium]